MKNNHPLYSFNSIQNKFQHSISTFNFNIQFQHSTSIFNFNIQYQSIQQCLLAQQIRHRTYPPLSTQDRTYNEQTNIPTTIQNTSRRWTSTGRICHKLNGRMCNSGTIQLARYPNFYGSKKGWRQCRKETIRPGLQKATYGITKRQIHHTGCWGITDSCRKTKT